MSLKRGPLATITNTNTNTNTELLLTEESKAKHQKLDQPAAAAAVAVAAALLKDSKPVYIDLDEKERLLRIPEIAENFDVFEEIGEGSFSVVYKGSLKTDPSQLVALKKIYAHSCPSRVANEIKCLQQLRNHNCICQLLKAYRSVGDTILVLEYAEHESFRDYLDYMNFEDTMYYMKGLLSALSYVHSQGIIHRDVKPNNFLFCRKTRNCKLVDFGLAQRTTDATAHNSLPKLKPHYNHRQGVTKLFHTVGTRGVLVNDTRPKPRYQRAGTRGFRAPEVSLQCSSQTIAIDIWSVGVIFLTILTRRFPFFESADDVGALVELACVFGSKPLIQCADELGKELMFSEEMETIPLQQLIDVRLVTHRAWVCPPEGYSLLEALLTLNPNRRISASEALNLPFFADIAQPQV